MSPLILEVVLTRYGCLNLKPGILFFFQNPKQQNIRFHHDMNNRSTNKPKIRQIFYLHEHVNVFCKPGLTCTNRKAINVHNAYFHFQKIAVYKFYSSYILGQDFFLHKTANWRQKQRAFLSKTINRYSETDVLREGAYSHNFC